MTNPNPNPAALVDAVEAAQALALAGPLLNLGLAWAALVLVALVAISRA